MLLRTLGQSRSMDRKAIFWPGRLRAIFLTQRTDAIAETGISLISARGRRGRLGSKDTGTFSIITRKDLGRIVALLPNEETKAAVTLGSLSQRAQASVFMT
jgi:hypothetical protein